MADFEDYAGTASNIALQIEQKLVVLNIDWRDESAIRGLAEGALRYDKATTFPGLDHGGTTQLAQMELFGLIGLMNITIAEAARDGQAVHGNEVWRALAKALWAAKGSAGENGST